jgi:hypothetical protein
VTSLQELEPFLAECEYDFEFYMGFQSYITRSMIPWPPSLRAAMSSRFEFEVNETPKFAQKYTSAVEFATEEIVAMLTLDIDSMKEATKLLDNFEIPHHNTPKPPNPMLVHPKEEDGNRPEISWREVKKHQRRASKTLKVAIERCIRRCIYFLLQGQLERYWPPPAAGIRYSRTYVDNYVIFSSLSFLML